MDDGPRLFDETLDTPAISWETNPQTGPTPGRSEPSPSIGLATRLTAPLSHKSPKTPTLFSNDTFVIFFLLPHLGHVT